MKQRTDKPTIRRNPKNHVMITLTDEMMTHVRTRAQKEERPITYICRSLMAAGITAQGGAQ